MDSKLPQGDLQKENQALKAKIQQFKNQRMNSANLKG